MAVFILLVSLPSCIFLFRKPDIHYEALTGNWIVAAATAAPDDKVNESEIEYLIDIACNKLKLMPVQFNSNSKVFIANGISSEAIDSFHYQVSANENKIQFIQGDDQVEIDVLVLNKDKLEVKWIIDPMNHIHRIPLSLNLFKAKNDEPIFRPELLKWKKRPLQPESNIQISQRLQSLLNYNYVYTRDIHYSNTPVIDTRKLYLPFKYYDGGIALLELAKSPDFISLFFDEKDAQKAYELLDLSLPKIVYPSKSNYVLEYADCFKELARVL